MKTRRTLCQHCARPQRSCLCRLLAPVANVVEVLILQHPLEVHEAKGSARLLSLSLAHCRVLQGEVFDAADLSAALTARQCTPLLLYPAPATPADGGVHTDPAPVPAGPLRLVVLDGTWRKSRKMLALNPLLQSLARFPLRSPPPSRYRIRKAHAPDQLSTLEATCHALAQLEGRPDAYQPLLAAFDLFVAQQLEFSQKSA